MPDKAAQALRRFCLECQGGHVPSVSACADADCLLYPWRRYKVPAQKGGTGGDSCPAVPLPGPAGPADAAGETGESGMAENPPASDGATVLLSPGGGTPVRAIRRFCLACAGSRGEVRECDAKASCPLWSFRFGVLPATFKRVIVRMKKKREELTLPGLPL